MRGINEIKEAIEGAEGLKGDKKKLKNQIDITIINTKHY